MKQSPFRVGDNTGLGINTDLFQEALHKISGVEQSVFSDYYGTGARSLSSSNQFRTTLINSHPSEKCLLAL